MQLIISVLILFILINCVLKLSFWRIWRTLCSERCAAPSSSRPTRTPFCNRRHSWPTTCKTRRLCKIWPLSSRSNRSSTLRLLHRRAAGLVRTTGTVVGETPEVVPQPTRLPCCSYLQTELVFSFPGTSFSAISYAFAAAVVVLFPYRLFRLLLRKGDAAGDALVESSSSSAC